MRPAGCVTLPRVTSPARSEIPNAPSWPRGAPRQRRAAARPAGPSRVGHASPHPP
jgi:hypothetical protein